MLRGDQQHIADRFAGRGGVKGEARYEGAEWIASPRGVSLLGRRAGERRVRASKKSSSATATRSSSANRLSIDRQSRRRRADLLASRYAASRAVGKVAAE